jgi:hypothetical protein
MKDLTNKEYYLDFTVTLNHPNECHPSWESHPLLLKEIDLEKNTELTSKNKRIHVLELSVGTNKKLDWKCSTCEHEWNVPGSSRVFFGTGCPACSNHIIHMDGRNSMAVTHPELAKEFLGDSTKIMAGTGKISDWKCSTCEHEWKTTGAARSGQRKTGCPVCAGQVIHIDERNSMYITHPKLTNEYQGDATKIIAGTHKKLDWKCSTCEHEWRAKGSERVQGTGCPCCANKVIHLDGRNSMAMTHPELVNVFQGTATKVITGKYKKHEWKCSVCGHKWKVSARVYLSKGCQICNSLGKLYPKLVNEWHPQNIKSPYDYLPQSNIKVKWLCSQEHEWDSVISNRSVLKRGCPYCTNQVVCKENCLQTIAPLIAAEWHPELNGELTPRDVVAKSSKKVWWKCPNGDDHEWFIQPGKRLGVDKTGCPYCDNQKVSTTNRLDITHPLVAKEWNQRKNNKTASEYVFGSNHSVWWECSTCQHEWKTSIINRTKNKSGCSSCIGMVVNSKGGSSIADIAPIVALEWHPTKNGMKRANDYRPSSSILIWWECSTCQHEWRAKPNTRLTSIGLSKSGCPVCAQVGFQPHLPAYYYVNEIMNKMNDRLYFKGGISSDWKKRLNQISRGLPSDLSIRNIEVIYFETGQDARDLETKLLQISDIRAPKRDFEGGNELFMENPLEYIRTNNDIEFMS